MKKLIKKIQMDCPICDKIHEIYEYKEDRIAFVKGEHVKYKEVYFYCENAYGNENCFMNGAMLKRNLINGKNTYRKKHGLLTSNEIAGIRKKYGLSQSELSKLLGWDENEIARYEEKSVQDKEHDKILRQFRDDALFALSLLQKMMSQ